jgi:ubiquinone/menaquinone biosynthesis C-methylase UbiE
MTARMNRFYDDRMYVERLRKYYGNSDFFNYGYWDEDTADQKAACENLLEKLLSFFPSPSGTILDVACGKGASSEYLLRYYKPQDISGINISEKQLATCREKIPEATFLRMDAAQLEFEDESFDNILCVEAVFHFNTRERFLREAYRVLKPGGCLALTDILLTKWGERQGLWWIDAHNAPLVHLKDYEKLYRQIGFARVDVMDATKACWDDHCINLARFCYDKLTAGEIDKEDYGEIAGRIFRIIPFINHYLLVGARKEMPE